MENVDPALSINTEHIDPRIGRLYRKPDFTLPENMTVEEVKQLVEEGTLYPSTTNIISVMNSPYLLPWAARVSVEKVLEDINSHPLWFEALQNESRFRVAVKHYASTPEKIRDAAGVRGTIVHEFCQYEAKGLPTPILFENLNMEEKAMVSNWRRWVDTFQPDFKFVEVTGFGKTDKGKQFAQTTDFIANINNISSIGDYKCVTSDTKIMLFDGSTVKAEDLKEGDIVASWSERRGLTPAPVSYVGENGNHRTVTVTTNTGHSLTTTLNHPYWMSRASRAGWMNAENLKVGDYVFVAYGWDHTPANSGSAKPEWPFNKNISPYLFGLLWSLAQFNNLVWTENTYLQIPRISRESLRDELKYVGFIFNKEGKISLKRAVNKIARKNDLSFEEVADLMTSPTLPNYVHSLNIQGKQAFLAGVKEVFANKEKYADEINVVFQREEPIRELQQFLLNYGLPAEVYIDNNAAYPHLRTVFEDDETIYTHGPQATKIVKIEYSEEPERTLAIEVDGTHTHITNGLITHNTNRSGLSSSVALQLAANSRTDTLYVDDIKPVEQPATDIALAVHISPQKVSTYQVNVDESVYEAFQGLRDAWDFYAFSDYDKRTSAPKGPIVREIKSLKDL